MVPLIPLGAPARGKPVPHPWKKIHKEHPVRLPKPWALPIYHQFSAHVHGEKEVLNLPLDFVLDVLVCSYLLRQTQVPKWIHWWGEGEWNGEWSVASRRVKRDDVTRHDCWYLFSIQKMINDYSKIPKWAFYQFLICATVKRSKHGLLFRFSHEGWSSPP